MISSPDEGQRLFWRTSGLAGVSVQAGYEKVGVSMMAAQGSICMWCSPLALVCFARGAFLVVMGIISTLALVDG
jgi:hypothetical protein